MKGLSLDAFLLSFSQICFLCCFLEKGRCQEAARAGALRQGLTWQHNGQVFSILSRGSQYQPSARGQPGSAHQQNAVVVLSNNNETVPAASRGSPRVPVASGSAQLRMARQQRPSGANRQSAQQETQDLTDSAPVNREDMMVGDDPYNPYKSSNYYPYYNYYNSYYRPRPRAQPRHGYGTSDHQQGRKLFYLLSYCIFPFTLLYSLACFHKVQEILNII